MYNLHRLIDGDIVRITELAIVFPKSPNETKIHIIL
jgi:hypothetical protein